MGHALDSIGRAATHIFVPIEGVQIPDCLWTAPQKKAFSSLKKKGFKFQNVVPLSFQCTSTGANETTSKNTILNMCYQAFCFHEQGFEDLLWWHDRQNHTIPCAAGDDSATQTSCTLDVEKYIADMASLH